MTRLDFVLDPTAEPEEAADTAAFFAELQVLIDAGEIVLETDDEGKTHLYPA